jgi:hypothetical protein
MAAMQPVSRKAAAAALRRRVNRIDVLLGPASISPTAGNSKSA